MKRSSTFALAAAVGTTMLAGTANAHDWRAFDEVQSQRAASEDGVRVRLSLPFGQAAEERRDPRLSFGFAHDFGAGQTGNLDLFSFSLAGDSPRLETPLAMNANGDGGWYSSPTNWLLIAAGMGLAWAVYDNNQDDDEPAPPPSPPPPS